MKARTYSEAGKAMCTMRKKANKLCQCFSYNTLIVLPDSKEALIKKS